MPAVKPAARATKQGRIGIAATNQAAKATYLRQLIDEFAGGIQAFAIGCPELVTLVEDGQFDGPEVEETVRHALDPILGAVPAAMWPRLIAAYDHEVTQPEWALGWRWDIVLRGPDATPFEAPETATQAVQNEPVELRP